MEGVSVRRITDGDGPLLRDLRLRSLAEAPDAFGQPEGDARSRPESEWVAAARAASAGDRRAWFIAEFEASDGHIPIGLVLVRRRPPDTALIFSMWVAPAHRRRQVGRALIDAGIDWSRGWGADRLVLWVFAANETAVRFYDRLGFTVENSGSDADSGRAYGALAMSRSL